MAKNTFLDPFLHISSRRDLCQVDSFEKPTFIIKYFFRNNWKRSHQEDFWTLILQILDSLFQILQNSDIFAPSNQSILAFVLYKIHQNKFPYVEILSFLKHFQWNLKFSYIHIYLIPIMYEPWKLKKVTGNKILFRDILELCIIAVFRICCDYSWSNRNRRIFVISFICVYSLMCFFFFILE